MRNQLKISIITVTLNCERYLEKAINSVCAQSYPNIEYLIIDGGSTDGTINIINQYRNNIDYFVSEIDSGIYNAMNKGINKAGGDVLFFLNADDQFCNSDVVSDIMHLLNSNRDLDMVYGNVLLDFPSGIRRWNQNPKFSRKALAKSTINHQAIFARKELFSRTKGFSEKFKIVSDYAWLMELVHTSINSMHVERDISIVCTKGLSYTTKWEAERIEAMREYYTPLEIFLWRKLPRLTELIAYRIKHIIRKVVGY